jgi:hypothetical protein
VTDIRPIEPPLVVAIEDVDDASLVADIDAAIRTAFHDAGVRGRWTVALAASETRGRWDLALKGSGKRHVLSFVAPSERLREQVVRHLARVLPQVANPRS